jgi:hypothetical protein
VPRAEVNPAPPAASPAPNPAPAPVADMPAPISATIAAAAAAIYGPTNLARHVTLPVLTPHFMI